MQLAIVAKNIPKLDIIPSFSRIYLDPGSLIRSNYFMIDQCISILDDLSYHYNISILIVLLKNTAELIRKLSGIFIRHPVYFFW